MAGRSGQVDGESGRRKEKTRVRCRVPHPSPFKGAGLESTASTPHSCQCACGIPIPQDPMFFRRGTASGCAPTKRVCGKPLSRDTSSGLAFLWLSFPCQRGTIPRQERSALYQQGTYPFYTAAKDVSRLTRRELLRRLTRVSHHTQPLIRSCHPEPVQFAGEGSHPTIFARCPQQAQCGSVEILRWRSG